MLLMIYVTMTEQAGSLSLRPKYQYCVGFEIAGIQIELQISQQWKEEKNFLPFLRKIKNPDFRVNFQLTDTLLEVPDSTIHEDECYRVHLDDKGGYLKSFFDAPRDNTPYAVAKYDYKNGVVQIDYLVKGMRCFSEIRNSFFHIGFEAMLIHKERICLHASCIDTVIGGLLFCGPSGIGKSTQTNLWCEYRNAKQINGDRPILSKGENEWFAWGSPYAGSSKCHINEKCAVKAILILKQAEQCSLRKLKPVEAFRAVWSGLTLYSWDKWFVETASRLTMELIENVPVFEFCCNKEPIAVEYLERELRKECCL